jgi:hypothetical protein
MTTDNAVLAAAVVVFLVLAALGVGWLAWRLSGAYTAHPEVDAAIEKLATEQADMAAQHFMCELRGWLIARKDPRIRPSATGWKIDDVPSAAADFCRWRASEEMQWRRG